MKKFLVPVIIAVVFYLVGVMYPSIGAPVISKVKATTGL